MDTLKKLKAHGRNANERILWMGMFCPAPTGRRGLPFVLIGEPGTVKTSTCSELSKMGGLHFETVIASIREPSDFLGLMWAKKLELNEKSYHLSPDGDDHIMVTGYSPSSFAVRATLAKRALVLLDEVDKCAPAVQAALLRLLFEGVCGELEMPPGVRFVLAMNHPEDGGWNVLPPLANRVGWLPWEGPGVPSFSEYLMGGGGCRINGQLRRQVKPIVDARQEEKRVDERWPEAWAEAAGIISGFLESKPMAANKKPSRGSKDASQAWPSFRTWDFATAGIAGCQVYEMTSIEEQMIVEAYVGNGAATELHTWRKNNDLPKPADLLDGNAEFTHRAARLDRTAAVLTSCTALVVDKSCARRKERAEKLWDFHMKLPADAADIAAGSVVAMTRAKLMLGSNTGYRVLAKYDQFLQAAGIVDADQQ